MNTQDIPYRLVSTAKRVLPPRIFWFAMKTLAIGFIIRDVYKR